MTPNVGHRAVEVDSYYPCYYCAGTDAELNFRWILCQIPPSLLFPNSELADIRKEIRLPKTHSNIPVVRQMQYGD